MGRILNFGSVNIDHVYSVEHFAAPAETISSTRYEVFPGGKGLNQSIALARGGGSVTHAGAIGPDGEWLAALLDQSGVDTSLLRRDATRTGHAIIQVDRQGQNCIILHGGGNREITPDQVLHAFAGFGEGDLLVLQNEVNLTDLMIDVAHHKNMQIALNPSPMDAAIRCLPLSKITWLLLNEVEGEALTNEKEPERIIQALLERCPDSRIVLTLGKAGVMFRDRQNAYRQSAYKVPAVDTTAAGDTFTGFFLSAAMRGESVEQALGRASLAAALAVSQKGAAVSIPTLEAVLGSRLEPAGI